MSLPFSIHFGNVPQAVMSIHGAADRIIWVVVPEIDAKFLAWYKIMNESPIANLKYRKVRGEDLIPENCIEIWKRQEEVEENVA